MSLPPLNFKVQYRRSTDTFEPDVWYVYKKFHDNKIPDELIAPAYSPEAANELARKTELKCINDVINAIMPGQHPAFDSVMLSTLKKEYQADHPDIKSIPLFALVERYFASTSIVLSQLQPMPGKTPPFEKAVKQITRPYIAITDEQQATLEAGASDYYLTPGGCILTFGGATCEGSTTRFALMPLQDEYAEAIKRAAGLPCN